MIARGRDPPTPATHDTYRADILLPTTRTRAPTAVTTATTSAPEAEPTSTHLKSEYQRHDTSAFLARARTPRHGRRVQELRDRAHAVERMHTDLRLFTLLDDHAPDLREARTLSEELGRFDDVGRGTRRLRDVPHAIERDCSRRSCSEEA